MARWAKSLTAFALAGAAALAIGAIPANAAESPSEAETPDRPIAAGQASAFVLPGSGVSDVTAPAGRDFSAEPTQIYLRGPFDTARECGFARLSYPQSEQCRQYTADYKWYFWG